MEKDRIAKIVYVGKCAGCHSVGRLRKREIDTGECFKEKGYGCQAKQGEWCLIEVNGGGLCGRMHET